MRELQQVAAMAAMAAPGPIPQTPGTQSFISLIQPDIPLIDKDEDFYSVVEKISEYADLVPAIVQVPAHIS